ncbi:MAG: hypothetical protein LBT52_05065, partial [Clostridiales Family XIII bacterium]|nr:hypothetical protein [Clostridiales Family XIII bacterium]
MKRQYAILEYDRIIKLLAERTSSALGAAEAEALLPVSHPHEIRRRLRETAEAVFVVMQKGSPGIGNFGDISQAVAYADRGGSLTPAQLLSVAVQLTAARRAAAFLKPGGAQREHHREEHNRDGSFRATASRKHSEDASFDAAAPGAPGAGGGFPGTPILSEIASVITVRKDLEDRISASILSDTEIADSASAELRRIRRQIITQSENIRAQLNKLISSSSYKDVLQDQIITQRDGRWVVPVKQESTKSVPGIIHDRSKGGATVFIEPQSVVNANNALRELEIQERQEIDRILAELSAFVAESAEELRLNQDMLVRIDFIFAKGLLAADMKASEPLISEMSGSLCINQSFADPPFAGQSFTDSPLADPPIVGSSYAGLPSATRTDSSPSRSPILEIENGRHPLIDPDDVVPISLTLGGAYNTLIITGPNTGGKTVTLKSVGLFVLMAQAGLHIPASRAVIPAVKKVFADIGDEQSIEQSLSTFSSHMKNIVEIVERADAESIVFFDELGAGTDPTEGAALAISILETLGARGCLVMATTHYTELKKYALAADGVENASMEFDIETLSPTYRLRVGLPGRSNAFEISRKLGLPGDVVSHAAQRMDSGSIAFETVI